MQDDQALTQHVRERHRRMNNALAKEFRRQAARHEHQREKEATLGTTVPEQVQSEIVTALTVLGEVSVEPAGDADLEALEAWAAGRGWRTTRLNDGRLQIAVAA